MSESIHLFSECDEKDSTNLILDRNKKENIEQITEDFESGVPLETDFQYSTAKKIASYSMLKGIVYFFMLYFAWLLWANIRARYPCNEVQFSVGTFCAVTPITSNYTCLENTDSRCTGLCWNDEICIGKFNISEYKHLHCAVFNSRQFVEYCVDPNTCISSDRNDVKQSLILVGLGATFHCILEIIYSYLLWFYSSFHPTDFGFYAKGILSSLAIVIIKNVPKINLYSHIILGIAVCYNWMVFYIAGNYCLTDHAWYFLFTVSCGWVALSIMGYWIRGSCLLPGIDNSKKNDLG